ncbi:MAG: hypothetical protein ACQESF_02400 [Nanobdellota archaeon]
MKKIYKFMGLIILLTLFLINFIPHYGKTPLHIDSWIQFSWAKDTLRNGFNFTEPFSGHSSSYPPLVRLILAGFLSTGLDLATLTPIISGLLLAGLGASLFLLSKELFNEEAALVIMAFTPLALSNITVLGPFFVVPLTFGMIFSVLLFYFALRENALMTLLFYVVVVLTHRSSSVFAGIGLAIIMALKLYEKKYKLFLKMTSAPLAGLVVFGFLKSFESIKGMVGHYLINVKQPPYISFNLMYTSFTLPFYYMFLVLFAIGLYLIIYREKKSSWFLISLFAFLAINAFLYEHFQGFLLVYRRLFGFLFLLIPIFVGYAVYFFYEKINSYLKSNPVFVMVIVLLLVLPWAVQLNSTTFKYPYEYINQDEHALFKEFGKNHSGQYLVASNLQYYALPFYNIEPVQGNVVAMGSKLHFDDLFPCYTKREVGCFEDFFEKNAEYKYLTTKFPLNSSSFSEYMQKGKAKIYLYGAKNI